MRLNGCVSCPLTQDSDTLEVGRTAYEMLVWEVHYLRGRVAQLLAEDALRGRSAKRLRLQWQAAQQMALRDPAYRQQALRLEHLASAEVPPLCAPRALP